MDLLKKSGRLIFLAFLIMALISRFTCLIIRERIVFPHDLPLLLFSSLFLLQSAAACFFGGGIRWLRPVLPLLWVAELAAPLCVTLFSLSWLEAPAGRIICAYYAVFRTVGHFEAVGETFSEWIYCGALLVVFVLFFLLNRLGQRIFSDE